MGTPDDGSSTCLPVAVADRQELVAHGSERRRDSRSHSRGSGRFGSGVVPWLNAAGVVADAVAGGPPHLQAACLRAAVSNKATVLYALRRSVRSCPNARQLRRAQVGGPPLLPHRPIALEALLQRPDADLTGTVLQDLDVQHRADWRPGAGIGRQRGDIDEPFKTIQVEENPHPPGDWNPHNWAVAHDPSDRRRREVASAPSSSPTT